MNAWTLSRIRPARIMTHLSVKIQITITQQTPMEMRITRRTKKRRMRSKSWDKSRFRQAPSAKTSRV